MKRYIICVKNQEGKILGRPCKIVHNGHIYPDYSLTDAMAKADKFNADKLRLKMYSEGSYYSIEELTDDLKGYHSIRTD